MLRLANNQIVELPPLRLPKLVSLSLANNALPLLPAASLSVLTALTNLNVERNQFSFWPISDGVSLPNLQSFNCAYNGVCLLPDNFVNAFLQLTELRLAAAQLDALPASLSRLTKLTSLDVSNNAIRSLSPVFALSNLEKLQVGSNRLPNLNGIAALVSLSRLEAAANALRALPADMTSLRNLEALRVENNELAALPAGLLAATPKLTELVLHHNLITDLPEELSRLKQLEILDVYALCLSAVLLLLPCLPLPSHLALTLCSHTIRSHNKIGPLSTAIATMPSLKSLIYDGSTKPPHVRSCVSYSSQLINTSSFYTTRTRHSQYP